MNYSTAVHSNYPEYQYRETYNPNIAYRSEVANVYQPADTDYVQPGTNLPNGIRATYDIYKVPTFIGRVSIKSAVDTVHRGMNEVVTEYQTDGHHYFEHKAPGNYESSAYASGVSSHLQSKGHSDMNSKASYNEMSGNADGSSSYSNISSRKLKKKSKGCCCC